MGHLVGGVVDEDVEMPEFLDGAHDELLAMRRIRDVARHQRSLAAGLFDPARRLLCVLVLFEITDRDIGALARKGDRDRPADTGIRARDQRGATRELAAPFVGALAVIGLRRHLARLARRLLPRRFEGRLRTGVFRIVVAHCHSPIRMVWNPNETSESPVPARSSCAQRETPEPRRFRRWIGCGGSQLP